MKTIFYNFIGILLLLIIPFSGSAQYFIATIEKDGNDIVFKVKPNEGGGDITAQWIDIEFFLRTIDEEAGSFTFGDITVNATDFPNVFIPYNGADIQGSEIGFINFWFGTSFSATPERTYTDGQAYELFRVTLDLNPEFLSLELVHNETSFITYATMINQAGLDLTNPTSLKFYGPDAEICSNCPVGATNHVTPLSITLPVELLFFDARLLVEQDVELLWSTVTEENTSHFEIQRSNDGQRWETIGKIKANGFSNTTKSYQFIDHEADFLNAPFHTQYYRLQIIDYDESYAFSPIRSVTYKSGLIPGREMQVYPNPVFQGDMVEVEFLFDTADEPMQLELIDFYGQRVVSKTITPRGDHYKLELPIDIPVGSYILKMTTKNQIKFSRRISVFN